MQTHTWENKPSCCPIPSQWVACPLCSVAFRNACHVTTKRQERWRAWHGGTPPPSTHTHIHYNCPPHREETGGFGGIWSLGSDACLTSPPHPLQMPSGTLRLCSDVSVISGHLLVRGREGGSSALIIHYSQKQYQFVDRISTGSVTKSRQMSFNLIL